MNIQPDTSIFNRLMMRLNPAYFNLSAQEQERFRIELTDEQHIKADIYLLKTLFGIKAKTEEESNAAYEGLSDKQLNLINAYTTLLRGIGEYAIYLNEFLPDSKSLRDIDTLYDYDLNDFNFQQRARKEEAEKQGQTYQLKPYRLYLYHIWARLIDNGCFYYSTISSLSYYLYSQIDEYINDQIRKLIPYSYKKGLNHGKQEDDGGKLWDMRADANGLEGQLDELKQRCYRYNVDLIEPMNERFHSNQPGGVYFLPRDDLNDPHIDLIVQNSEAAKLIRFQSFLSDCRALQRSNVELDAIVADAKQKADLFVLEQYRDIIKNFDPKVSKFKKLSKVVIAPEAQKDINF